MANHPQLRFGAGHAVTTILAAEGYPNSPKTGEEIFLPSPLPPNTMVFHAGTRRTSDGTLQTAGGRVLAVTAVGETVRQAVKTSQSTATAIKFKGAHFRKDIATRELERKE
jgi:phosphoribosylamine--glycine ligase